MLRLLETGEVQDGGWIEVQDGIYRYAVDEFPRVRIVLREYLAAEVVWDQWVILEHTELRPTDGDALGIGLLHFDEYITG